ncbi:MAG: hypothetical protein AB7D00_03600 [Rhodospirillaceae bacterium]
MRPLKPPPLVLVAEAEAPARQTRLPLSFAGQATTPARLRLVEPTTTPTASPRSQLSTIEESRTMRTITNALHADAADVGGRWAAALRSRWGSNAKLVARALNAKVRTAESWLAGQAPSAEVLARAGALDPAIVLEVLAPGSKLAAAASVDAALVAVEARLAALGREIAGLKAGEDG